MKRKLCISLGLSSVRHTTKYVDENPMFTENGAEVCVCEYHSLKPCSLSANDFNLKQLVLSGVEPDNSVARAQRSKFGLINSIHFN